MPRLDELLSAATSPDTETQELLSKLRLFSQKRFWHEYGEHLTHLIYSKLGFNSLPIIETTIAELNTYLDPFLIVELLDVYLARSNGQLADKLSAIERTRELVGKVELAGSYLAILEAEARFFAEDFEAGFAILTAAEKTVDAHRAIPRIVFAALNHAKLVYHLRKEDLPRFYDSVIKFLAYCDERKMSPAERLALAEQTLQAAAVSEQILSFADILQNPFFRIVADQPSQRHLWTLIELLNQGNVDQFENFLQANAQALNADPLLRNNIEKLRRKIRVIALYDSVFFSQKTFTQQSISFQEIANIARIDKLAAEKLIVHMLSIGLLKGYVDDLNELFYITGLKPQDLDLNRLRQLKEKFENWNENIKGTIEFVNRC